MTELTDPSLCTPTPFDPFTVAYSGAVYRTLSAPEGIGHKAQDTVGAVYGTIHSEPAVSRFHELGRHDRRTSWAGWGGNVYLANGGRPVWLGRDISKFAGVLPPVAPPTFEIVRRPLWVKNEHFSGTPLINDPVDNSSSAQDPIYHYDGAGNAYLTHPYHADTVFSAENDWIAFKGYINPHSISGRHLIYSSKVGVQSGGVFIDIIDGRLRIGAYNALSKREDIWAETNVPVFAAGEWHYVHVRKKYPAQGDTWAWNDSLFGRTVNVTADLMVVRQLMRNTVGGVDQSYPYWIDKALMQTVATKMSRMCISFTTDDQAGTIPSGTKATGFVSDPAMTYSSSATIGQYVVASGAAFTEDMIGMIWQWGDGASVPAAHRGKSYRITLLNLASASGVGYTTARVVDLADGSVPDFHADGPIVAEGGGVFTGVKLLRDVSTQEVAGTVNLRIDQGTTPLSFFGSSLALEADSGVARSDLEFASFALAFDNADGLTSSTAPDLFEDSDPAGTGPTQSIAIGCDDLEGALFLGVAPGELHADAGFVWLSVDTQVYAGANAASSTPNAALDVAKSAESDANASNLTWAYLEALATTQGERQLRVRFYDEDQAAPSNPGPQVTITHAGEDLTNPSGWWGILIKNLPVSVERGSVRREVFMTLSDGATLFLVAVVPDNESSSILIEQYESRIANGIVLEVDNNAPPRCDQVEESNGVLAFGKLSRLVKSDGGVPVDALDSIVFSKPFLPVQIPYSNFFQVPSGFDAEITGMVDHNGYLIVAKRESVYRCQLEQLAPKFEIISRGSGVVASDTMEVIDGVAYWLGGKGFYAYAGSGEAKLISDRLEDLFTNNEVASQALAQASAAINRLRNQYVLVFRKTGDVWTQDRLSTEFADDLVSTPGEKMQSGHRFSRYDGVNIVSVGQENDPRGGPKRLIGGTDDGFVLLLDRRDTNRQLIGPTSAIWGDTALVAGVGSTTTRIVISSGVVDVALAGSRSAVLRWGTEVVRVLFAESGVLHLDRPVSSAPASGQAMTLGVITHRWKTKIMDVGVLEARKHFRFLDVTHRIEGAGIVAVTAIQDGGVGEDFTARPTVTLTPLDLRSLYTRLNLNKIRARFIQFEFTSTDPFEILQMTLRVSDQDTRP